MAYIQRNIPPPNKILTFIINDMTGGLNNRSSDLEMNEASDVINMAFTDEVVMEKRNGTEYFDATTLNSSITYINKYRPYTGSDQFIRATNSEVYAGNTKIADVAGKINGVNFMGNFVFVDGNAIYFYGVFPQASASPYTVVTGTPVATPVKMKLVNPPSGFTPLGTTHTQGVYNYNYTSRTMWYEPCDNEIKDTSKGSNVIPEKPKFVDVRLDRLYLSGGSTDDDNIFISDISNGLYFPVFLPVQVPPNSDKIAGLSTFHDTTVVGRHDDVHVIYGNTNRTSMNAELFRLKQVNAHAGFASQDAVDHVHNHLFYMGSDGNAYGMHTTETDVKLLATTILNQKIDFFKSPINASMSDLPNCKSIFFNDEWYVAISDKVMVYSYRHMAWTMYKFNGFNVTSFYVSDNTLLMGTNTGRIVKFSDAYAEATNKPYQALWASSRIDLNDPSTYKQFRELYIVAETFTDYEASDIKLRFEVDYVDVHDIFEISNQISRWGISQWGDRFINRNIVASYPIIIGRRGRSIKIIYSNSYFDSPPVETLDGLVGYPDLQEGTLVYVNSESKYYLYTQREWVEKTFAQLTQPMRVYEINGQYELRGKR